MHGLEAGRKAEAIRVLLVVDEAPFPPRNGVTIPVCGMAHLLLEHGHEVHGVLLTPVPGGDPGASAANRQALTSYTEVLRTRRPAWRLLADEVLGRRASFTSYDYGAEIDGARALAATCDAVLASPISALDAAARIRDEGQRVIGAISDSYTAVLRTERRPSGHPARLGPWMLRRLRGLGMGRLEARALAACDAILVQTPADRAWIGRIGGNALADRTFLLPNGVDAVFFAAGPGTAAPGPVVLSVADYSAELYRRNLEWFHREVWPRVRRQAAGARLRVVGRGLEADPGLSARLRADTSVEVEGFVPDLVAVYRSARVAVAVVRKEYGFINKVAEALAAGVPVVGDPSAFNGMGDVTAVGACRGAVSPREFAEALVPWLTDEDAWRQASGAARRAAMLSFGWETRWPILEQALTGEVAA